MSCLALKSLMFRSNLGLINTVSSVRSKPSFEVLKLASLRSSGGSLWKGETSQKRFSLFSFSQWLPAMQATWGSLLGLLLEGGHLHGAWSGTKQAAALFGALAFHTDHPTLCRTSFCLCIREPVSTLSWKSGFFDVESPRGFRQLRTASIHRAMEAVPIGQQKKPATHSGTSYDLVEKSSRFVIRWSRA